MGLFGKGDAFDEPLLAPLETFAMGLFSRDNGMPKFLFHDGEWHETAVLINDTWIALAGMSWDGYQAVGRGAVIVGQNDQINYVPAAMPALAGSREPIAPQFRRSCAKYHPEREFVILASGAINDKALRNGKLEAVCGIVKGTVTPPQAYEAVRQWEVEDLRRQVAEGR